MLRYVIISPVRNEEEHVRATLESVINQTLKPAEWMIVNDGSTDNTENIIQEYTSKYPWIKLHSIQDRGYYFPGTGVVKVVQEGFSKLSVNDWDFVVKLDADISIEPTYFEEILGRFEANPKLGIASGAIYLKNGKSEIKENSQPDHPWGASKIYRKACFDQIGGWKPIPGWDLADLLGAQMKGWETRCFDEYKIYHFRGTGLRRTGFSKGRFLWGRFHYRYGYGPFYTLLKSIFWLKEKPLIIGGISIFAGYIYAAIRRENRLFEKDMRKFLRQKQRVYLKQKIAGLFK
ncbi:MAG: glycosyltransferase family 2 protein [Bacteroidetes bacterium]|nr:glycosyltransferase family 2 protein [Bacteroidota bacterium]